jgi:Rrf2 family transcriptional regulator, nitric oxide-sensitive transcriptional repressor
MLTQTVEYALRATLHIAREFPQAIRVNEIADAVEAPRTYLAKILGDLARAGILESTRGPAGGFRLARDPALVTLSNVVVRLDGRQERRCLLGGGRCGENPSCTAHARWAPIANEVDAFFGKTTLADLLHTPTPLSR